MFGPAFNLLIIYSSDQISGTAAKLVRDKAYHHCTLLLSADKNRLNDVLHSQLVSHSMIIYLSCYFSEGDNEMPESHE